jgi:hypothetical protein
MTEPLRPRDLALLLLASKDLRPRKRARDQRADAAGLELRRRVLERLAALDPPPEDVERTLAQIIDEFGDPSGPTRAIALSIHDEWRAAQMNPRWLTQLRQEAAPREDRKCR